MLVNYGIIKNITLVLIELTSTIQGFVISRVQSNIILKSSIRNTTFSFLTSMPSVLHDNHDEGVEFDNSAGWICTVLGI